MSFFPNLFKSFGVYKLIVNQRGEVTLISLDKNGVENSMCCGDFEDVFFSAFKRAYPDKNYALSTVQPSDFCCDSWGGLCDILNSKKKCKTKILWSSMVDFRLAAPVEWNNGALKYVVKKNE